MLIKQIGNVIVNFEPIIIFFVIIMIVYFLIALSLNIRGKKVRKFFEAGAYDKVLIDGERLLKTYQKYAKRYKHKNTIAWIEYLHFSLAVSNFSTMNWNCFLNHINSMLQYGDVKNFWLSLYYICQNNLNEAQTYYDNITQTEENATNISYLDCLICYNKGDVDLSKAKMQEVYKKLKHPILKHIVDKLFDKDPI